MLTRARIWLERERPFSSALAVLIFTSIPFLDFYAANIGQDPSVPRVVSYLEKTLGIAFLTLIALRVVLVRVPLWRLAVPVCVTTLLFFSYAEFKLATGVTETTNPILEQIMLTGVGLLVAASALAFVVARRPMAIRIMLVIGASMLILPIIMIGRHDVFNAAGHIDHLAKRIIPAPVTQPNVYWIILDGYPRGDLLEWSFGFDNSRFLDSLKRRGFQVLDASLSNYALSIYSVASTLSMDYVLDANSSREMVQDLGWLRRILRGESATVGRLRALGYRYVHFANGYDFMTLCDEQADKCVVGNKGLDEFDVAILGRTPIVDYLLWRDQSRGPEEPSAFDWGAVDELEAKLPVIWETPNPFFLYAHVIAPHPPIRLDADCVRLGAPPDLRDWDRQQKSAYVEQIKCVNRQMLSLLDRLQDQDPTAIIIIQADHGSAFESQFETMPDQWTHKQFLERFSVLNAMRLPPGCLEGVSRDLSLVNTFVIVLSCVENKPLRKIEDRYFISAYDNGPAHGWIVEYDPSAKSVVKHNRKAIERAQSGPKSVP